MIKTSYNNKNLNYGDIFEIILFLSKPKSILEVGILDGFSLDIFAKNTSSDTIIEAYDIFDEFNGNGASKDFLLNKFKSYSNIKIEYGDFYKLHKNINNFDLIHIDIANNGDIIEYALNNYISKLNENGIIIFEGGSLERDNIDWMIKYDKPKINPIVKKYNLKLIGSFPSVCIFKK